MNKILALTFAAFAFAGLSACDVKKTQEGNVTVPVAGFKVAPEPTNTVNWLTANVSNSPFSVVLAASGSTTPSTVDRDKSNAPESFTTPPIPSSSRPLTDREVPEFRDCSGLVALWITSLQSRATAAVSDPDTPDDPDAVL